MRLFSYPSDRCSGAVSYGTQILMYLHIASTLLTLLGDAQAASLPSNPNKNRLRSKIRSIRNALEASKGNPVKERVGERDCSELEKLEQGCLAGSCAALVTSQYHTFVICRCPSNRQGPRCEEVAINTDSIAKELQKPSDEDLCKEEKYDMLAKSLGYESMFFIDCVNKNYPTAFVNKKEKRAKLKKMRERARKRKLRKRQRKREKKRSQRSGEKSNSLKDDVDGSRQLINTPDQFLLTPNDFNKKSKEHRVRHESEKSSSRRRRKSLLTFLVGTSTATTTTPNTMSTGRTIFTGQPKQSH